MAHAKKIKEDQRRSANYCAVIRSTLEYNLTQKQSDDQRRRKQSRVGGGGGQHLEKGPLTLLWQTSRKV